MRQRPGHGLAGLEGAQPGGLDGGTVGHRIGEGHAELDHVGAAVGKRLEDGERGCIIGVAGGDEGDEAGAARRAERAEAPIDAARRRHRVTPRCSATVKMSLSPRPHIFMTKRWSRGRCGAISMTLARAWAGSRAGMMPSSSQHSLKAASAS